MTTHRIIRPRDGKEVAAVTSVEAAAAVSRMQGREWLVVCSPSRPTQWYFDGERAPLEKGWWKP